MIATRPPIAFALALIALLATESTAEGQIVGGTSTFIGYRNWTIAFPTGDVEVSQLLVPVSAQAQLTTNLDLTVWDAGASSRLRGGGATSSLAALSAAAAQASLRLADDRLLLQAGVSIPSGKRGLDAEEIDLLRLISLPLLHFGLTHYGRGPELNVGASVAVPWSESTTISLGTGYTARGEYALFENTEDYRPASEWAMNGGVDWGNSDPELEGLFVRANATLRLFGKDQIGGHDVFEEGRQLELGLAGRTGGAGVMWNGAIRAVFKADNTIHEASGTVVSQLNLAPGRALFASGGGSLPLPRSFRAGLDLEWAIVSGGDDLGRDGFSLAVGPSLEWSGDRLGARVRGAYLGGHLNDNAATGDASLHGLSTDVSLQWTWGS